MLAELPDGLRLHVERLQEFTSLLGNVVVDEVGHAESFHVRPLEAGQMDPALNQGCEGGRVVGRARDQDPGVWEQSTFEQVGRVAERRSSTHALIVTVQDEEHAILHQVQSTPHLSDRVTQCCRPWQQLPRQVIENGTAAKLAQGNDEGQRRTIALRRPLVQQSQTQGSPSASWTTLHGDASWRLGYGTIA